MRSKGHKNVVVYETYFRHGEEDNEYDRQLSVLSTEYINFLRQYSKNRTVPIIGTFITRRQIIDDLIKEITYDIR